MIRESTKKRVFEIIQIGKETDFISRTFDFTVVIAILLNLMIAIAETFEQMATYHTVFQTVELITVIMFTVEFLLRLWTAEYLFPGNSLGKSVLKFVTSFTGIVDLLAFLPYYLPFFFPEGAVAFRMFRIVRILRLFRVNKYYDALNVIGRVLRRKRSQLISSVFIILVLMTASSLCMYSLEHEAQPEVFQNAFSGFWWAVSTLLTVGYGDIYPITIAGRIFGIGITFLGVGMVAVPTGILSAGFVEEMSEIQRGGSSMDEEKKYCPYCGKKLQ